MEKPSARGPSPAQKAKQVLGAKLNRKFKKPPPLLEPPLEPARKQRSNKEA